MDNQRKYDMYCKALEVLESMSNVRLLERDTNNGEIKIYIETKKLPHGKTQRGPTVIKFVNDYSSLTISTDYAIDDAFEYATIEEVVADISETEKYSSGHETINTGPPYIVFNYEISCIDKQTLKDNLESALEECQKAFFWIEEVFWVI